MRDLNSRNAVTGALALFLPISASLANFNFSRPDSLLADETPTAGEVTSRPSDSGTTSQPSSAATSQPSSNATSQPTTQPALSFSKSLRAALRDSHDDSASNQFSDAVLSGKVTPAQYGLALKQNLAIFECFQSVIIERNDLPESLKKHLSKDLRQVVDAFRKDLKFGENDKLTDTDVLEATKALLTLVKNMNSSEVAVVVYLDLGGNAFGTHDLAKALNELGMENTEGFTIYTFADFKALIARMNITFDDSSAYPDLITAGKRFFEAHAKIYASPEFVVSK